MRFQAVTQIVLVIVSLVIIFTVVRPLFDDIRANQDEIERYREAINTVGMFNTRLAELRTRASSFSNDNMRSLNTYLPSEVDLLSVSRDVRQIAAQNSVVVQSVGPDSEQESEADRADRPLSVDDVDEDDSAPVPATLARAAEAELERVRLDLSARGTYEQLVGMLIDFEQNAYPLRLVELELAADSESSAYIATIKLETYALPGE